MLQREATTIGQRRQREVRNRGNTLHGGRARAPSACKAQHRKPFVRGADGGHLEHALSRACGVTAVADLVETEEKDLATTLLPLPSPELPDALAKHPIVLLPLREQAMLFNSSSTRRDFCTYSVRRSEAKALGSPAWCC